MMDSKTVSTAQHQPKYFYCNNCLTNLPIFDDLETPATTNSTGGTNKLYYTNCSHVVCQACRTTINNCCPFCKRKAQMMQISRRMPRHMQMYFEPLRKSIQNVLKVAEFQKEQQRAITSRLVHKCQSIKMKAATQKTDNDKCHDNRKRVIDDYKKVKQILTNFSDERQRRNERQQHHPRQQNRDRTGHGPYQERPVVYPSPPQQQRRSSTHRRDVYTNLQYRMSPLVYHEMARSTRDSGFDYSTP